MDRLFDTMELVREDFTPELEKLFQIMVEISDNAYAMDYNDYEDWLDDESEDGAEALVRELLKDYLKNGEK